MSRYVFKLPDVGEGTTEAEIVKWHVAVGSRVKEDEPLLDVSTDKAVVEIPAPVSGIVLSVRGAAGDAVPVGTEMVVIETDTAGGQAAAEAPGAGPAEPGEAPASATVSPIRPETEAQAGNVLAFAAQPAQAPGQKPVASPAVRRRARELEVELRRVAGTGPGGRILHGDLDAYLASKRIAAPESAEAVGIEEHKVIGVRRRIAERTQEAKRRIPHFSYVEEVDMTALEDLRRHLNANFEKERPRLTLLPFIIKAMVRALAGHPEMNARYDDEKGVVARYKAVHVGVATQTDNGLLVPVLRNAERLDLWGCAAEIARLANAAREGKATRQELAGSTISITSLGALGGIVTTPIINYPEVAIVGVNKLAERPMIRGGRIVARSMMNLSSSFDHRVVDGWNAAGFIQKVKEFLEQPATLFIE